MKPDELRALADEIERWTNGIAELWAMERRFASAINSSANPDYLTNLQDAVDAVPEGWSYAIAKIPEGNHAYIRIDIEAGTAADWDGASEGKAPTPAAALCAAILRAKAAEREGE